VGFHIINLHIYTLNCYPSTCSPELGEMITNRLKPSLEYWPQPVWAFQFWTLTYLDPIGCRVRSPLFTSFVTIWFWHGMIGQF